MMTTMLKPALSARTTTDAGRSGYESVRGSRRSEVALAELTHDLTSAVDDAYFSFMLQGDLEDAFDSALFRAALAETPVLSGALPVWSL